MKSIFEPTEYLSLVLTKLNTELGLAQPQLVNHINQMQIYWFYGLSRIVKVYQISGINTENLWKNILWTGTYCAVHCTIHAGSVCRSAKKYCGFEYYQISMLYLEPVPYSCLNSSKHNQKHLKAVQSKHLYRTLSPL